MNIIPTLLVYPVWGLAKQFLLLGVFAWNLKEHTSLKDNAVILITSVLFSLVHFPDMPLVGGTFFLALVYSSIFLRYGNLWILGLAHGWLGSIFYFFALGRDAWEIFVRSI